MSPYFAGSAWNPRIGKWEREPGKSKVPPNPMSYKYFDIRAGQWVPTPPTWWQERRRELGRGEVKAEAQQDKQAQGQGKDKFTIEGQYIICGHRRKKEYTYNYFRVVDGIDSVIWRNTFLTLLLVYFHPNWHKESKWVDDKQTTPAVYEEMYGY